MEDYGTTAKFTQFTTVLAVVQSALATVVGKIGIKAAIETTANRTDEVAKLLHAVFLSLRSGQKLIFEPTPAEQAEVFMVVKLGMFDQRGFIHAIGQWPRVTDHVIEIIETTGFKVQTKQKHLTLVRVSVFQLGFTENPTYNQICLRAMDLGYSLCPNETALLVWINDVDFRQQYRLIVATPELSDSMGGIGLFCLERHSGERWLSATSAHQSSHFPIDTEFVFTVSPGVDF